MTKCYNGREHLVRVMVCFLKKSSFGSTPSEFGSIWCIISSNKGRIQHVHAFFPWPWVVCSWASSKSPKSCEEKSYGSNLQDAIENGMTREESGGGWAFINIQIFLYVWCSRLRGAMHIKLQLTIKSRQVYCPLVRDCSKTQAPPPSAG